jgi:hypothetical protein
MSPSTPVPTRRAFLLGIAALPLNLRELLQDSGSEPLHVHFLASGSWDRISAFADAALTRPVANPLRVDGRSVAPTVFLDPSVRYRVVIADAAGATLHDHDPYLGSGLQVPGAASAASQDLQRSGTLAVTDFGAVPDGATDNSEAFERAVRAASEQNRELRFPSGTYAHSKPLLLNRPALRVRGEGLAILKYTGPAGPCVVNDAGEKLALYDTLFENFTIDGDKHGTIGLFVRNMPHGVRRNISVRNVSDTGFMILGDVLSLYDSCRVSANEGPFTRIPGTGWSIGGTTAVSSTTACTFLNCLAETATQTGWQLREASQNLWLGGTSEGLGRHRSPHTPAIGLRLGPVASGNNFQSFFCELNDGGDLVVEGSDNLFVNCSFTSRAKATPYDSVRSVRVMRGATGNRFEGGTSYAILIADNAKNTSLKHLDVQYRIEDAGAGTVISDCLQLYNSATRFPSRSFGNIEDPDPKALDWYQEVRFVPQLRTREGRPGATVRDAQATRIGNLVSFSLSIELLERPASAGPLMIDGLPFPSRRGGSSTAAGLIEGPVQGSGATILNAGTVPGTSQLRLLISTDGQQLQALQGNSLQQGAILTLTGQYFVS